MNVYKHVLHNCYSEDADNVDQDNEIEDEKSELDRKRDQTMLRPTQDFVTDSTAQDMISADKK